MGEELFGSLPEFRDLLNDGKLLSLVENSRNVDLFICICMNVCVYMYVCIYMNICMSMCICIARVGGRVAMLMYMFICQE